MVLNDEAMDHPYKYQHDNHMYFEKKKAYRGDLSKSQRKSVKYCLEFFFLFIGKMYS